VKELQAKLAEHVPQSTYDELVSKVVQLAEEVTGGQSFAEESPAQAEPEEPSPAEQTPSVQPEVPARPTPIQAEAALEAEEESDSTPEIREIGSQLAELQTDSVTEPKESDSGPTKENPPQEVPAEETDAETRPELAPEIASGSAESGDHQTQSS
jgi:hypothetical protein